MSESYTYILFSSKLNKFYIGATRLSVKERYKRHISSYYGESKFTSQTKDWVLFFEIKCSTYSQALKIEKHIKRMKSTEYIKNLKLYPEIIHKLQEKYK
jgi:putative endonuclease